MFPMIMEHALTLVNLVSSQICIYIHQQSLFSAIHYCLWEAVAYGMVIVPASCALPTLALRMGILANIPVIALLTIFALIVPVSQDIQ